MNSINYRIYVLGAYCEVEVDYIIEDDAIDLEALRIIGWYDKHDSVQRRQYTPLGTSIVCDPQCLSDQAFDELIITCEMAEVENEYE